MRLVCGLCAKDDHDLCTGHPCQCDHKDCAPFMARTTFIGDGPGKNYIGPDGRVYWEGTKEEQMDSKANDPDFPDVPTEVVQDHKVIRGTGWVLVDGRYYDLRPKTDGSEGPTMVMVPAEQIDKLGRTPGRYGNGDLPFGLVVSEDGDLLNWRGENYERQVTRTLCQDPDHEYGMRAENGDPFYQRAKKALGEIATFRRVDIDHETDIITTSDASGQSIANYRSGIEEITITITGYTR